MKYIKAENVFPQELLVEIQKHIQGEMIYIPKQEGVRKKWGESSGNRKYLEQRNSEISDYYSKGYSIEELAKEFYLSISSIKRIVYSRKN